MPEGVPDSEVDGDRDQHQQGCQRSQRRAVAEVPAGYDRQRQAKPEIAKNHDGNHIENRRDNTLQVPGQSFMRAPSEGTTRSGWIEPVRTSSSVETPVRTRMDGM